MAEALRLRVAVPEDAARISQVLAASYGTLWQGAYPPEVLAAVLPLVSRARPELLASGRYVLALRCAARRGGGGGGRLEPGRPCDRPDPGALPG